MKNSSKKRKQKAAQPIRIVPVTNLAAAIGGGQLCPLPRGGWDGNHNAKRVRVLDLKELGRARGGAENTPRPTHSTPTPSGGGSGDQQEYYKITLNDVIITSY